jgi:hypothetical protein
MQLIFNYKMYPKNYYFCGIALMLLFIITISSGCEKVNWNLERNNPYDNKVTIDEDNSTYLIPLLHSPENGAKTLSSSVKLMWIKFSEADKYQLQIEDSNGDVILDENIIDTNLILDILLPNSIYYWRVRAININYLSTEWTDKWRFTTPNIVLFHFPFNDLNNWSSSYNSSSSGAGWHIGNGYIGSAAILGNSFSGSIERVILFTDTCKIMFWTRSTFNNARYIPGLLIDNTDVGMVDLNVEWNPWNPYFSVISEPILPGEHTVRITFSAGGAMESFNLDEMTIFK